MTAIVRHLLCLAVLSCPLSALAQGATWGETSVELHEVTGSATAGPNTHGVPIDQLPQAPTYEGVTRLRERVEGATVPVRAVFRRDPLITPNTVAVEGVATWVDRGDGQPILITASFLVDGAEHVELLLPDRVVPIDVDLDPDFGLAVVAAPEDLTPPGQPLVLSNATADTRSAVYGSGSSGGTMGAADGLEYYQLSDSGVILGHPIVDGEGQVIGIGSHRHPGNPLLSLAVPARSVDQYLEQREAGEEDEGQGLEQDSR